MAAIGKLSCIRPLVRDCGIVTSQVAQMSTQAAAMGSKRKLWYVLGGLAGSAAALAGALEYSIAASGVQVSPYKHRWPHHGLIDSYDHASIRRGWEVYKNVCASCHSLELVPYRRMINVFLTEDEAKAEAAAVNVTNKEPDETGASYQRPGRLYDYVPGPYPNEEAARHANNGAYPPDLSLICLARKGGANYIFALLTGYTDPPAGVEVQEGQHFNPYFAGGAISMAQSIYNETVEFSDGTPASASQIAKDVCHFLEWSGQPHVDQRRKLFIKLCLIMSVLFPACLYIYKRSFLPLKTQKLILAPPRKVNK